MEAASPAPAVNKGAEYEHDHDQTVAALQAHIEALAKGNLVLFTTNSSDTDALWQLYKVGFAPEYRKYHDCRECQKFIERFGNLVTIDDQGKTQSVMWNHEGVKSIYQFSWESLRKWVETREVDGVFVSAEKSWGTPVTKDRQGRELWTHVAVVPPKHLIFRETPLETADQHMAKRKEEYGMLLRGLEEYPLAVVTQAHTLLSSGQLFRSEKCIGVAKWLMDLHEARASRRLHKDKANITWRYVATAPPGFCHVKTGMIGTLMDDIKEGKDFAEIKRSFDSKMDPTKYQRAQVAPAAGNVAAAEKLIGALQTAGALERRFARLSDLRTLWTPGPPREVPTKGGIFSGVKTKKSPPDLISRLEVPPTTMIWEKFRREILPETDKIELYIPDHRENYGALVTAANSDAPPILQWDEMEERCPISTYVYTGGSTPSSWFLKANLWHPVSAVCLRPHQWFSDKYKHHGRGIHFLLQGSYDVTYKTGAGFFTETLKADYHPIRSTLEAFVKTAIVAGHKEAEGCGLILSEGKTAWKNKFRVTNKKGVTSEYILDRWD
jgi:hypothetical protein